MISPTFKACIFDLDGVIVDTARYHYAAWKEIARRLGYDFKLNENEALKGVSRSSSLDIIISLAKVELSQEEKDQFCEIKNQLYRGYIREMTPKEILPGVVELINALREYGIRIALGSASKNALFILSTVQITHLFDVIIDGNQVSKAKPNPEVFLKGAEALGVQPSSCIVFEDAAKGLEAAKSAQMMAVGIGKENNLPAADLVISGFIDFTLDHLIKTFQEYISRQ